MRFFKSIENIIVKVNMAILVVSLFLMVVLGFVQIVLRNGFDSGFTWADIIIRNLVLWVGFSGAVVATSRGRHIAIGALVKFIPGKAKRLFHFIVSIFTAVVCFFLAHASFEFISFEREANSVLFGKIPVWFSEIIIPITFCFLTYQFALHAFEKPPADEGEPI